MTAVPFIVLLVIFAGTKIAPKGTYNENYLSLKNTNALRGMCALIVAMQHTCAYQHDEWTAPFLYIGFLCTSIFFFLSGYGLMYGVDNKRRYLKNFLKKRLLTVLLPYLFANVIYLCIRQLLGLEISLTEFLKLYQKGEPYVSFSWFIISIMYFYVMFYVVFNIFTKNIAVFLMIPGSVLYMYLVKAIGFDYHWYTTAFCFSGGVIWYRYRDTLTTVARKQGVLKIVLMISITLALLFATFKNIYFYIAGSNITALCFQIVMMLLMQKIRIHNFVLEYLGKVSFEFYILHGIVIKIFNDYLVLHGSLYVLAVMMVSTLIATLLYKFDKIAVPWTTGIEYGKKRVIENE